ncbi:MAG: hypothetical protein M0P31_13880 [Solirubrobacteraceae bacterium]|nr:hypothetical protein [Solirubrobacteraceae bacterium]
MTARWPTLDEVAAEIIGRTGILGRTAYRAARAVDALYRERLGEALPEGGPERDYLIETMAIARHWKIRGDSGVSWHARSQASRAYAIDACRAEYDALRAALRVALSTPTPEGTDER